MWVRVPSTKKRGFDLASGRATLSDYMAATILPNGTLIQGYQGHPCSRRQAATATTCPLIFQLCVEHGGLLLRM